MDMDTGVKNGNKFFLFVMIFNLIAPIIVAIAYVIVSIFYKPDLITLAIASTAYVMLIPTIIYMHVKHKKYSEVMPFKAVSIKNVILIILISLFIQPVMSLLSAFGMLFFENNINDFAQQLTSFPYILGLLAIAVTPAIFEELLMRGAVMDSFEGLDLKTTAIINGFFFGLLHGDVQQFLYATMLGFIFVYFVKLTGSILSSILSHFVINGLQITLAYIYNEPNAVANEIGLMDVFYTAGIAIPSLIVTVVLMIVFIKNNKEAYIKANENKQKVKIFDKYFIGIIIVYILILVINKFVY